MRTPVSLPNRRARCLIFRYEYRQLENDLFFWQSIIRLLPHLTFLLSVTPFLPVLINQVSTSLSPDNFGSLGLCSESLPSAFLFHCSGEWNETSSTNWGGENHPEPDTGGRVRGRVVVAVHHAAARRTEVPTAAAKHAVRARAWTYRVCL